MRLGYQRRVAQRKSRTGCLTKVSQTGSKTSLPEADKEGWSLEIALDVETVRSACQNCKILLVEANEPTDADLAAAVNEAVKLGATEVSNSYGGTEEAGEEAAYSHLGQSSLYDVTEGGNGYCDGEAAGPCGEPAINEKYGDIDCQGTTACDAAEYHFRIVTKNAAGTVEGPDVTFKTLKVAAPSVETKAASAVGQTSATLNASVNPRGAPLSTCKFEYGTTTGYGSSAPCATLPGSGSSPVAVSALLTTGLIANTEYHFRITATNAAGTSKGGDVTFRTT